MDLLFVPTCWTSHDTGPGPPVPIDSVAVGCVITWPWGKIPSAQSSHKRFSAAVHLELPWARVDRISDKHGQHPNICSVRQCTTGAGSFASLQRFLFCPMSRNHGMQHDLSEGTPWAGIHMISSCASSGRMCEDVAHKGLMRSTNSPLTLDEFWWAMKKNENDLKWLQVKPASLKLDIYNAFRVPSGLAVVSFFELAPWKPLEPGWCSMNLLSLDCCWGTVHDVISAMTAVELEDFDFGPVWQWQDSPPPCNAMAIYGTPAGFPKVSPVHCHYVSCFIGSFYIPLHILDPTSSPV